MGMRLINELIEKAKDEKVDFIVSLGDICLPIEKNQHVLTLLSCDQSYY